MSASILGYASRTLRSPAKLLTALLPLAFLAFLPAIGAASSVFDHFDPRYGVRLEWGMSKEDVYDILGRPIQVVGSHKGFIVEDITWRCPGGVLADLIFVDGRLVEHRTLPRCFVQD